MTPWNVSHKNQSTDLFCKSMDWFLYNRDHRHERINSFMTFLKDIAKFPGKTLNLIFLVAHFDGSNKQSALVN